MLAVRRDCKSRIFQVKVQLREVRPSVWRWVLIPGEATLGELHEVLQIAMGWTNSHLFAVDGIRYGVPDPDPDWGDEEVVDEFRVPLRPVRHPRGAPRRRRLRRRRRPTAQEGLLMPRAAPVRAARPHPASAAARTAATPAPAVPAVEEVLVPF